MMKPHFTAQAKERQREQAKINQPQSLKVEKIPHLEKAKSRDQAGKAAGVKFDSSVKLAMAFPTHPKLEHIGRNARRYNVHGRTIYRWLNDRVSIENPEAVLAYLLTQRNPSQSALDAIKNILLTENINTNEL
jgi:hypothetical protein